MFSRFIARRHKVSKLPRKWSPLKLIKLARTMLSPDQKPYHKEHDTQIFANVFGVRLSQIAGADILDYGGGNGKFSTTVAAQHAPGAHVYLAELNDYDPEVMVIPHDKYIKVTTDNKIRAGDNSFDVIILRMVLHHVRNIPTCLHEIFRVLRPGGYIYLYEHDVQTEDTAEYLNLVHMYYHLFSFKTEDSTETPYARIAAKTDADIMNELKNIIDDIHYYSRAELAVMLKKCGARLCNEFHYGTKNPQRVFAQLWRR